MLDKRIARAIRFICEAQIASDAGKGIWDLRLRRSEELRHLRSAGYAAKDKLILEAMREINCRNLGRSGINYYVDPGENEISDSVIVYFDIKIDNKRYQVSFHTFTNAIKAFGGKGRQTHWDHNPGGSRSACRMLIKLFNL